MAMPTTTNSAAGGGLPVAAVTGVGSLFDAAVIQTAIAEAVKQAIAPLREELDEMRSDIASSAYYVSHDDDDDGDDDESSSNDGSSDGGGGAPAALPARAAPDSSRGFIESLLADKSIFVNVDPTGNPHWGAATLSDQSRFKPHRYDLWGHRPWMVLSKGGAHACTHCY
jgi:hypothetical protein